MTVIIYELCGQLPPRPFQLTCGYYPAGVRDLPGEKPPVFIECPECGHDFDLREYPEGIRECDCGYEFRGDDF